MLGRRPHLDSVSGKGRLYSYTIAQAPTHPAFADDVPYVIAIVELAEGPHITTNLVGCQPDRVTIGMPLWLPLRM